MPFLTLHNLGIEFKIYQGTARLARKAIFQSVVGGSVNSSDSNKHILVRALQDITVDIRSGERIALLGHNGAGKTTLLRAMGGIYKPTSGRFTLEGRRVPLFDIGLGFDEEATGYENILLRGLLMGLTRTEIEAKVDTQIQQALEALQ